MYEVRKWLGCPLDKRWLPLTTMPLVACSGRSTCETHVSCRARAQLASTTGSHYNASGRIVHRSSNIVHAIGHTDIRGHRVHSRY